MTVSQPDEIELAALVTARICHDLVSPVGAVDNGIELISALGQAPHPTDLALVAESARMATLKLRMFRLAFGSPKGPDLDPGELQALACAVVGRPRQALDWKLGPTPVPRERGKLILLLVMCLDSAMARGGTLSVGERGGALRLRAQTDRPRIDAENWAHLGENAPDSFPVPGQIHFAIAGRLAKTLHLSIATSEDAGGVTLVTT